MSLRTHNRFTLIELLVVVTIIAVLASLLLPVLGEARARGRAVSCLNTARQLQLGFSLYTDANDGQYTRLYDGSAFWTQRLVLEGAVNGPLNVPATSSIPASAYSCPERQTLPVRDRPSYGLNLTISQWGGSFTSLRDGEIPFPSQTFVLVESLKRDSYPGKDWGIFMMAGAWDLLDTSNQFYSIGHAAKTTTSFADGHVEGRSRADMMAVARKSARPWSLK